MKHGTDSYYQHKRCRCPACRAAHAKANKAIHTRIRRALKANGWRLVWIKDSKQGTKVWDWKQETITKP